MLSIGTCPYLNRAVIEALSIHCGITVEVPFVPSPTSTRARLITQAIASQTVLNLDNLLKARVLTSLLLLQLPYYERVHTPSSSTTPYVVWNGWTKKFILNLVTFTLQL